MVSPEQSGVLQTGGLAHAVSGLTEALNGEGYLTEVLMPFYYEMDSKKQSVQDARFIVGMDWENGKPKKLSAFSLYKSEDTKNPTLFLKHESKYGQTNYFDNRNTDSAVPRKFYAPEAAIGESFAAFAKAAADFILSKNYDIVILNDWTTGLIATYLKEAKEQGRKIPKIIFAVHNLAYQGLFPKSLVDFMGLNSKHFSINGYEYWNQVSFLKAGLQYSDMTYTVSPQYAKEIGTIRYGAGLDGLVREQASQNRITGILNGITNQDWDPSLEVSGLKFTFDKADFTGKDLGKVEVLKEFGMPSDKKLPLFILTSRLAEQKGFEYLVSAIEVMAREGKSQWIVIGDGDLKYIRAMQDLQAKYPDHFRYARFSSLLEKKLTRYADFFVNGAWFEPSGLNQFFAKINGTIPVVSASGGLLNSVKDGVSGILFKIVSSNPNSSYDVEPTVNSTLEAFQRAAFIYGNKKELNRMRLAAMATDESWTGRVRSSFKNLFDYVLNDQQTKSDFLAWKSAVPACSKVHLNNL